MPTTTFRRFVAAAALAVAGSGLAAVAAPTAGVAAAQNPPALWMKLDGTPTSAEAAFAAAHYRVVVLNPWETTTLQRIKAANPAVTVLAYKCLSSTRSYSGAVVNGQDAAVLPTGVGYVEASAHPEWFALDTNGSRVQWGPYPGHWQMAVWNAGYQQRWAANVAREVAANGWDGVMADNALTTLKWYSSKTLAGAPTAADLRAGERSLIAAAAAALHANGKLLVPNIGESRLYSGLWNDWTGLADGGQEESFAHMDEDPSTGFVGDWGPDGYAAQAAEVATPRLNLAITRYLPGDLRSFRYGYSMFLVNGGGRGAFTASSDYGSQPLQTEQTWDPGTPVTGITRVGPAYVRQLTGVWAVTNPSETQSVVVPAPAGALDAAGAVVAAVTLAPHTGAVLRLPAGPTTTTTTPPPPAAPAKKWKHYTTPVTAPVAAPKAPSARRAASGPAAGGATRAADVAGTTGTNVTAAGTTRGTVRGTAGGTTAAAPRGTRTGTSGTGAIPGAATAAFAASAVAGAARYAAPAAPALARLAAARPLPAAGEALLVLPLLALVLPRRRRAVAVS